MKIFHLADLHLGKSIYENSLILDQEYITDMIVSKVKEDQPDCLIMAGDIFDRAIPPPEAIHLFGSFVAKLRSSGLEHIAIISGNHDSAARLSFLSSVLEESGVYIACKPENCDKPIIIKNNSETLRLWLVPFLTAGAFILPESETQTHGQVALFNEAVKRITIEKDRLSSVEPEAMDVIVCHIFAQGGIEGGSEQNFVGNAELVSSSCILDFDYAALGHLHRYQQVEKNIYYSGSILPYSFEEGKYQHGFIIVNISKNVDPIVKFEPLLPMRKMTCIQGSLDELVNDVSFDKYKDDYIEATLDNLPSLLDPMNTLRKKFPWVLSIRQNISTAMDSSLEYNNLLNEGHENPSKDFERFYLEMNKKPLSDKDMVLFEKLYKEAKHEN